MNGWLGITTVQKASKDRGGDSGGFYFFLSRTRLGDRPAKASHPDAPQPIPHE